ncbi:conserved hypothetical protein [Rubrivivax sp. A210]|uniref:hypothetical protein n=1 Tax=Rubrivivax sp. A210 TaxID=2772301 RepID=UPI001917FED9|nr:hypothetical protein [Rubrivivax sp. A210]CAD5366602.1 conserved hypothetical protein [Rubrivivax sp. A210]
MPPHHLTLVSNVTAAIPGATGRKTACKVFWKVFLDWLAVATADETEQLERALAGQAHHVRPLVDAVSDALHDKASAQRLPFTLLASLVAADWRPAVAPAARAA